MIGRAVVAVAAAVSLSGCMLPFVIALTATELKYESSHSGVCDDQSSQVARRCLSRWGRSRPRRSIGYAWPTLRLDVRRVARAQRRIA
jgi:hypothetical protein